MNLQRSAGWALIVISIIHMVLSVAFGTDSWSQILQAGLVNTMSLDGDPNLGIAFWTVIPSFASISLILGSLLIWLANRNQTVPHWVGWSLLGWALICALMMPAAGFWLLLIPSILLIKTKSA